MRSTGFASFMILAVCFGTVLIGINQYRQAQFEDRTLDETTRATIPGSFVQLSDGYTHYILKEGSNDSFILLVHGYLVSGLSWSRNVHALNEAGHSVIVPDLYGRGYSDRPDVRYGIDVFVQQINELLDALEVNQPVHLVGVSAGAPIVAELATQNSHRVATLTIIDPQVSTPTRDDLGSATWPLVGQILAERELPDLIEQIGQSFPEWEDEFESQARFEGYSDAVRKIRIGWAEMDLMKIYDRVANVGIPTQLIWAEHDRNIDKASELSRRLEAIKIVRIQDSTHGANYHQPELINSHILAFAANNPGSSCDREIPGGSISE